VNRLDLGAWVAVAFARPLSALAGSRRETVIRYVRGPHTTVHEIGLSAAMRCAAWLCAGIAFLGLGAVAAAVEDITNIDGVISGLTWAPMGLCLLTGVLSAIRAGVAWYTSEERWGRAGPVLHWVVTPGNRDVVISLAPILAGVAIAHA
jgi:hypothetical protein